MVSSGVEVPGSAIKRRVYWLYPVIAPDTKRSYDELNKFGIDAYKGVTQLNLVEPPIGTSFKFPENAARMINDMVYLPIHRNVPASEIVSMAKDASNIILSPKL